MSSPGRHVAVVVPSLTRAGAERVAETLAREFLRTSRVTLVTMEPRLTTREMRKSPSLPWSERIPDGCHHRHLPSSGAGLVRLVPLMVRFALLSRHERFDVVFSFLTWTNVLVAGARLLGGRFVHVASEHALAASLRSDGGGLKALARTLPLVYRWPDRIVVVSDAVRSSMRSAGLLPRNERVAVVPNPIDGAGIRRLADQDDGIPEVPAGYRLLVCVARLHAQKDHATLLRALARLPQSYLLQVVGDGPLRGELADLVGQLGLEDRVSFTGVLQNPYPRMSRAAAVVLPSREEGFGLVAAEAGALDIPFVGTEVGGLAEVCAALGYLTFPVGDDERLALILEEITAPGRPELRTAEVVDDLFHPSNVAEQYLSVAAAPAQGF